LTPYYLCSWLRSFYSSPSWSFAFFGWIILFFDILAAKYVIISLLVVRVLTLSMWIKTHSFDTS
jgi:hypothetical protein